MKIVMKLFMNCENLHDAFHSIGVAGAMARCGGYVFSTYTSRAPSNKNTYYLSTEYLLRTYDVSGLI
jgi:hypothetical protein